jgi:aldose 1-epimerase
MTEIEFHRESWGIVDSTPDTPDWASIEKFTITVPQKQFEMTFTNLGASILQVRMADRNNNVDDIHYGRPTADDLFKNSDNAYLGSIVGRVASTIPFARFNLDGTEYHVTPNMMKAHSQHGGRNGFNTKLWECVKFEKTDTQGTSDPSNSQVILQFAYTSVDGDEGYPGNLKTIVEYKVTNDELTKNVKFSWEIRATTDKTTIVNIINHAYWNLDGVGSIVDNLELQLNSSRYMLINMKTLVKQTLLYLFHLNRKPKPFSFTIQECEKSGFGFRNLRKIGTFFTEIGDLDHNFLLDGYDSNTSVAKQNQDTRKVIEAAVLYSPTTGRRMTIATNQPAIIAYSGNYMDKVTSFKGRCQKHAAICLETACPTNAINIPNFQDMVILHPKEEYVHKTLIQFSIVSYPK